MVQSMPTQKELEKIGNLINSASGDWQSDQLRIRTRQVILQSVFRNEIPSYEELLSCRG